VFAGVLNVFDCFDFAWRKPRKNQYSLILINIPGNQSGRPRTEAPGKRARPRLTLALCNAQKSGERTIGRPKTKAEEELGNRPRQRSRPIFTWLFAS
jgi:hypothetical protein